MERRQQKTHVVAGAWTVVPLADSAAIADFGTLVPAAGHVVARNCNNFAIAINYTVADSTLAMRWTWGLVGGLVACWCVLLAAASVAARVADLVGFAALCALALAASFASSAAADNRSRPRHGYETLAEGGHSSLLVRERVFRTW